MCTLAWGKQGDRLWVCFNRDEQRKRLPAERPQIHSAGKAHLAYARDPEGGGTWFAVNSTGLVVALLNHYPDAPGQPPPRPRSRGLLVPQLAQAGSVSAARKALAAMQLHCYRPWTIFLLSQEASSKASWNGSVLDWADDCPSFETSSSFRPSEVARWRSAQWERHLEDQPATPESVSRLFRQTASDLAYGFTMDRDDARTVSQITLEFSREVASFRYAPREMQGQGYQEATRLQMELA